MGHVIVSALLHSMVYYTVRDALTRLGIHGWMAFVLTGVVAALFFHFYYRNTRRYRR
jgi:succinate dehydrogenase/fumarate reductase cytochrome b subunit